MAKKITLAEVYIPEINEELYCKFGSLVIDKNNVVTVPHPIEDDRVAYGIVMGIETIEYDDEEDFHDIMGFNFDGLVNIKKIAAADDVNAIESYNKYDTWKVILWLLFLFPVGVGIMWKYSKFNIVVRYVISATYAILLFRILLLA